MHAINNTLLIVMSFVIIHAVLGFLGTIVSISLVYDFYQSCFLNIYVIVDHGLYPIGISPILTRRSSIM